jgi:hypothetical protein
MGQQNYPNQQNAQPGQPSHEGDKPGSQRPMTAEEREREDAKKRQQQGGKQY